MDPHFCVEPWNNGCKGCIYIVLLTLVTFVYLQEEEEFLEKEIESMKHQLSQPDVSAVSFQYKEKREWK